MKRAGDIAAVLMLGAGPCAVAALQARGGFMDPMLAGALLGALAASVLLGAILIFQGRAVLRLHPALIFLVLYTGVAFLSATAAKHPGLSLRASGHLLILAAAVFLFSQVLANSGGIRGPLTVAALAAGLFSVHAIAQFTGHDFLAYQIPYRHDYLNGLQTYSVFGNPALFADFLAISFPLILGLWVDARRPLERSVLMVCGVLCLAALGLTVSRSAILAAGCGGALYLGLDRAAGDRRGRGLGRVSEPQPGQAGFRAHARNHARRHRADDPRSSPDRAGLRPLPP